MELQFIPYTQKQLDRMVNDIIVKGKITNIKKVMQSTKDVMAIYDGCTWKITQMTDRGIMSTISIQNIDFHTVYSRSYSS